MTPNEIRSAYIRFFTTRGHSHIPSASLVPENDPTTLFTGSGMQPLVPYLLGKNHPAGSRLVDSQKCFRAGDIEEVGDNRHTTFFEMLGNWSLGDYFKKEQLPWVFTFLVDEIGIDPQRLYVTAFIGDDKNDIPKDTESAALWKELFASKGIDASAVDIGSEEDGYARGMQGGRIFFYNAKKNWWSRAGVPELMPHGEPGGPDSEIFYEFTQMQHDTSFGPNCHPNCDCGRFLEIGNSVFMQYLKKEDNSFGLLPKQNVDFGGGLERIAMVAQNNPDIIAVNHEPILRFLESKSAKRYGVDAAHTKSFRIIADHMKASVFLIAAGVLPSKSDKGYFVRRLIRRSVQHADKLGISDASFAHIVEPIAAMYSEAYPEIQEQQSIIERVIAQEEEQFRSTLSRGLKELARFTEKGELTAQEAFQLFATYGFPLELIIEELTEKGIKHIDLEGFKELLKQHQELSRAGAEHKFKGGLADASAQTTRLHTAHHLLLRALQIVLGPEVHQRGSNITQERLRIDFSYPQKMTDEQKHAVEKLVNEKIEEDLPVIRTELSHDEAERLGAEHEFGAKYPDRVSVYSVGPKGATNDDPRFDERFSVEYCGGPHVTHTGELLESGHFKILKEEAVSAGVRRIKAVLQ